jgi:hypothetical protein
MFGLYYQAAVGGIVLLLGFLWAQNMAYESGWLAGWLALSSKAHG